MSAIFSIPVQADWLSVCEQAKLPDSNLAIKHYYRANGERFSLVLSKQKPQNCQTLSQSISGNDILWMELINPDLVKRFGNQISLQGVIKDKEYKIAEIIPQKDKLESELYFPLLTDINILPEFEFRPFGVEGRVTVHREGKKTTINCDKGEKTAGVLFKIRKTRLPLVKKLVLVLDTKTNGAFSIGVADQRRFEKGNPISLGKIENGNTDLTIPRSKLNQKTDTHWSILCPKNSAQLTLNSFSLHSRNVVIVESERSMWFWQPEDWQQSPDKLIQVLNKYKADDVFISVLLDEEKAAIKNEMKLAAFIRLARGKGIHVWAVEGDPHVILPGARKRFEKRAMIFAKYNKTHNVSERLEGIQYDIEPYLVAGYALSPEEWVKAYVKTIRQLKSAANMPLEIVIPFWWQEQGIDGKPMLDKLAGFVDSVNVMNYRTTKPLINRFAQPLLDWGMRNQVPINIALEAGPIVDETQWRYRKEESGELWHLSINQYQVLILNNKVMRNLSGDAYKLQFERVVSGDIVTFEHNKQDLLNMLPELEKQWSNWSSFNGISLHGLDD